MAEQNTRKNLAALAAVLVVAVVIGGIALTLNKKGASPDVSVNVPVTQVPPVNNGTMPPAEDSVSDGTISFAKPDDFGLAVKPEQVLVQAYTPPCEEGFAYCLYYNVPTYKGTNFESAGVAIRTRADLLNEETCLTAQPEGYADLVPVRAAREGYGVSTFAPIGDAGAGHYASGEEHRVFTSGKCYQFDTRIGSTQFANYPEGTITEFTAAQQQELAARLKAIVSGVRVTTASGASSAIQLP